MRIILITDYHYSSCQSVLSYLAPSGICTASVLWRSDETIHNQIVQGERTLDVCVKLVGW